MRLPFQIFRLRKIDRGLIRPHCAPNTGGNESRTEHSYRDIRKNSTTRAGRREFLGGGVSCGREGVAAAFLCTVHAPHAPHAPRIANTRVVHVLRARNIIENKTHPAWCSLTYCACIYRTRSSSFTRERRESTIPLAIGSPISVPGREELLGTREQKSLE